MWGFFRNRSTEGNFIKSVSWEKNSVFFAFYGSLCYYKKKEYIILYKYICWDCQEDEKQKRFFPMKYSMHSDWIVSEGQTAKDIIFIFVDENGKWSSLPSVGLYEGFQ